MYVPGRRSPGLRVESQNTEEDTQVCRLCHKEGKGHSNETDKYSKTSSEYLCHDCFVNHNGKEPRKHDVLSDDRSARNISDHRVSDAFENNILGTNTVNLPPPKGIQAPLSSSADETLTQSCYVDFRKVSVSHVSSINVKTAMDRSVCDVTKVVFVQPASLIAVDNRDKNRCIKIIDMTTKAITCVLQMSSRPWDLAVLPHDEAAVTLPNDKMIQIITTGQYLSLVRTIKIGKTCQGIGATGDKLVVSCAERGKSKLVVLSLLGERLRAIKIPDLISPMYVTVENENGTDVIYVSDSASHNVNKVTLDGKVLWTYSDSNLRSPHDVALTSSGHLLICNPLKSNIHVISKRGLKMGTLLNPAELGGYCRSVCCSGVDRTLIIGCDSMDGVKVAHLFETSS